MVNPLAIMVNKRVPNAVLGCNLKNDRMISVHFQGKPFSITIIQGKPFSITIIQGKPFSITIIQVYAPTSNAEEAEVEVERFYEDLQDLLEHTKKMSVSL